MEVDHQCDPTGTFLRLLVISGFFGVLFVVAGAVIGAAAIMRAQETDSPPPALHRAAP